MRTFYLSSSVRITERTFQVAGMPRRDIQELDHVYVVVADTRFSARESMRQRWPSLISMAASAPVIVYDLAHSEANLLIISAIALFIAGAVLLLKREHVAQATELWAIVRGRHVFLYGTTDHRVFDDVVRALMRALGR